MESSIHFNIQINSLFIQAGAFWVGHLPSTGAWYVVIRIVLPYWKEKAVSQCSRAHHQARGLTFSFVIIIEDLKSTITATDFSLVSRLSAQVTYHAFTFTFAHAQPQWVRGAPEDYNRSLEAAHTLTHSLTHTHTLSLSHTHSLTHYSPCQVISLAPPSFSASWGLRTALIPRGTSDTGWAFWRCMRGWLIVSSLEF